MVKFKNQTLQTYISALSRKQPTPGGGSAAALTASLGIGLILMVAEYSKGRPNNTKAVDRKLASLISKAKKLKTECLNLVDRDVQAYNQVVKARKKDKRAQAKAKKEAARVPMDICKVSFKAVEMAPYLVKEGNPHLVSDVQVATELLFAAFNSARVLVKVNQ